MKQIKTSKKGSELTFQIIATLIIGVIVLILMAYFFSSNYSSGSENLINIGNQTLNNAITGQ